MASSSPHAPNDQPEAGRFNPIVSALHDMAVTVLGDQLRAMFEKADDILFDSAEKAQSNDEQRLYLDTMRIVRVQRAKILKAFRESLEHALSQISDEPVGSARLDDVADMSQWSLQDGDVLEERIAVSNMETKAASLHAHELVELQRRLARLADLTGGGLSPEAISPARIIRAFQRSVQNLQVDFPIKLVIYKLFDRVVVGGMSEMFANANQLLAGHGVDPKDGAETQRQMPSAQPPPMEGDPRFGAASPGSAGAAPAWASGGRFAQFMAPQSPSNAWSAAGYGAAPPPAPGGGSVMPMPAGGFASYMPSYAPAYGGPPAAPPPNYDDAWLTHDIAQILQSYSKGQAPRAPAWLPPQQVGLVARMFDGYYSDPRMPDALKPLLARLQLPVMKAALSDPHFFTDTAHPARRASNSLYELALQLGSTPNEQALRDLEALVEEVARAFELDPTRLKAAAAEETVDDEQADRFLHEQDITQQARNRQQVERVRRLVAHELKLRIGDRELPTAVMRLMLAGFGPRLCVDYIRDGVGGQSWEQSMALVERVLASLDTPLPEEERTHEEAEIVAAVSSRLSEVGFTKTKLEDVIAGLVESYLQPRRKPRLADFDELEAETAVEVEVEPPPRLSPEQELQGLLSIVLLPGAWYTIIEAGTQTRHWVRVKAYYPTQHSLLLGHYMEERYVKMRTAAFATELAAGRIAAIEPSPDLQQALARIVTLPFEAEPLGALQWVQGSV
ncbi:DUF1631 family protein [Solimonas marina]|uniref:DUF1631 domain-containing protein n=1 Tax=Solimonas marina TaxID=2714601 RepID=A0A969W746_9GAMM|nr:DUF1631 family protein [Solimonas marina]NKF21827.1 DUF1631 domain-containing protein [Solimonas marina]